MCTKHLNNKILLKGIVWTRFYSKTKFFLLNASLNLILEDSEILVLIFRNLGMDGLIDAFCKFALHIKAISAAFYSNLDTLAFNVDTFQFDWF